MRFNRRLRAYVRGLPFKLVETPAQLTGYRINPLLEKRALIEFLSVAFGSRHPFNGRRIELSRDFDAVQLRRAIEVLEGF